MKYIIIILLLTSFLNISAQKFRPGERWKVPVVYGTSMVFNAVGDGLNDSGHKDVGHCFNAASIGLVVMSPLIFDYQKDKWYIYPLSCMFVRIGVFDWAYNWTRGLPYNYIGGTSIWDKGMKKLAPPDGFALGRVVSFTVGFTLPLNFLK